MYPFLTRLIQSYVTKKIIEKTGRKLFPPIDEFYKETKDIKEANPGEDEYMKNLREMQAIFGSGYSIPRFPIHLNNREMSYYTKNPQQLDNAGSFVKHEYNNQLKQDYINIHGFGMGNILK